MLAVGPELEKYLVTHFKRDPLSLFISLSFHALLGPFIVVKDVPRQEETRVEPLVPHLSRGNATFTRCLDAERCPKKLG